MTSVADLITQARREVHSTPKSKRYDIEEGQGTNSRKTNFACYIEPSHFLDQYTSVYYEPRAKCYQCSGLRPHVDDMIRLKAPNKVMDSEWSQEKQSRLNSCSEWSTTTGLD